MNDELVMSFCDHVVGSSSIPLAVARRPLDALQVWRAIGRLPQLSCSALAAEGRYLRFVLHRPAPWPVRDLLALRSVLAIPLLASEYTEGRSRQTLRRKIRVASNAGISVEEARIPSERRRLLALMIDRERAHPDVQYRNASPDLNHLLEVDLWLVAYAADGRPLLVTVTPVAEQWSLLSYFRTLEDGEVASAARYLMTAELVEQLRQRGIQFLLDPASPFRLPAGLRHFQRMLGWTFARVRLTDRRSATAG